MSDFDLDAIRARAEAATAIPGLPGYVADHIGQIWSTASNWRGYGARPLAAHASTDGYLRVRVYRAGRRTTMAVHRLVALAYLGNPQPGQQVRHLDGDQINNAPSNLAWGTAKENADDRQRHGRTSFGARNGSRLHPERLARGVRNGTHTQPDRLPRGESQGSARLTESAVREIRRLSLAGTGSAILGRRFGVDPSTVRRVVRGEAWAHVA